MWFREGNHQTQTQALDSHQRRTGRRRMGFGPLQLKHLAVFSLLAYANVRASHFSAPLCNEVDGSVISGIVLVRDRAHLLSSLLLQLNSWTHTLRPPERCQTDKRLQG